MWSNSGFGNLVPFMELLDLVNYMAPYYVGSFRNLGHGNLSTSLQKTAFFCLIYVLRDMCWQSLRLMRQKFLRIESCVVRFKILLFTAVQRGSGLQLNISCVVNIRAIMKLHSVRGGGR